MGWKCHFCITFIALTLRLLMRHIFSEHSYSPNFSIKCDLGGCPNIYTKYNSFYRHVVREHLALMTAQRPPWPCQYTNTQNDEGEQSDSDHELDPVDDGNLEDNDNLVDDDNQYGNNADMIVDDHINEQRQAISYLMGLRENHRIRGTTAEAVAEGTNAIVLRYVNTIRTNVYQILQREGIDPANVNGLSSQFDVMLPFEQLTTAYEREQYIKRNFYYVNPEYVCVGQNLVDNRRQRARDYIVREENFAYFPMNKSLEQFFQNSRLFEIATCARTPNNNGFYNVLSGGSIFINNALFHTNSNALQIILYFDDLEICNPMNKKAGSHKLGLFYYTIGNLPQTYRSRLPAVRTLAIIKRKVMNKHTINVVLESIRQDLIKLEQGITITVSGVNHFIKGSCLCFIGDNSAAHEFGGFKIGVGFSFKKCRECECTFRDMQSQFHERLLIKRSKETYERACNELLQADTQHMRGILSTNYGISQRSVASDFPNFDITKMIPQDIMHVMFEGVGIYETKAVLTKLVEEQYFNLNQLNAQIENFRYGFRDRASQPVPIPQKVFNNNETNLRQSASSMIVLMKLLPFILVEKLHCDSDNQYISFLTELCNIALIILSPVVSVETILMLQVVIQDHLKKFKLLFPNKNIIPKQHYMVHLPSTIERYGSLTNVWSMRFEGKHQFIKQRLSGSNNFKNVVKSVADRCAMY
ncbi:uncharacterized protein LOC123561730 [Mercenaria mercenaria]|uniref:uncharacterized protein LOC123561730 n=1 Tax=Mercenaria mercenaria TaxID=6596 RepID=UPI00234F8B71|nr:uncharacterized protein LOC123561730 [Mercenaria mercenaria]